MYSQSQRAHDLVRVEVERIEMQRVEPHLQIRRNLLRRFSAQLRTPRRPRREGLRRRVGKSGRGPLTYPRRRRGKDGCRV